MIGSPPASTTLDLEAISAMADAMRPGQFVHVLAVFLCDVAERLGRVTSAVGIGDMAATADECHDLVSTLGTFGAPGAADVARSLRIAAQAGDREGAEALLGLLQLSVASLRVELARLHPEATGP